MTLPLNTPYAPTTKEPAGNRGAIQAHLARRPPVAYLAIGTRTAASKSKRRRQTGLDLFSHRHPERNVSKIGRTSRNRTMGSHWRLSIGFAEHCQALSNPSTRG